MKRIAVTLAVLLVTLFMFVGVTSSTLYDPWYDFDDDGDIDIYDIVDIAGRYGTTGTPINKTELLLELQERVDLLNATVMALQGGYLAETGEFDGVVNADMVEDAGANTVINFQTPFTSVEKPEMVISVVLKQAANGLTEGSAIKVVEDIKGATGFWTGFDLTVSKYSDGSSISDSTKVYVTWIAIGRAPEQGASPKECLVVTGSIPYDGNGAYDALNGLSKNVSSAIPSGYTLVSVFATGYKAHEITGARQAEPPLILEPKASGTAFQTRVWDASGDEYGGSNWSSMTAHIDYTLFATK